MYTNQTTQLSTNTRSKFPQGVHPLWVWWSMQWMKSTNSCEAVFVVGASSAFNTVGGKIMVHNIGVVCPIIYIYSKHIYEDNPRLIVSGGTELWSEQDKTLVIPLPWWSGVDISSL